MYSSLPGLKRPFNFSNGGPEGWINGEDHSNSGDGFSDNKRKRKSRWSSNPDDKIVIPGMPTVIPANLTESQQRQYVVHLQIEEFTRKLRTGDLGISGNPEERSPSPEPIYNNEGKRMNTREYRTRKKLEEDRHKLIQEALKLNPEFKPPGDYKPPIIRVNDKVMIPQEEHPEINFVGLLIGPRGNTLKNLEKETGAKIIIRGKGSVKDGKIGRKDGQPLPGEDEPLHAYVTAHNPENVTKAVDKIKEIIRQGIEVPEGQNDLRRQQLRELALLNGTLRENDGLSKLRQIAESQTIVTNTIVCTICGGAGHIAQDCKQKRPGESFKVQQNPAERAKMDSEYMSLMAELGEGPPPPPPKTESTFTPPYGRPLLSNPPPNPMAMNSPWQMNPRSTAPPLLTCPSYGMPMGPPQINPRGRLPMPAKNSSIQAHQMATSQSQQQQQQSPLLGGMGTMPPMGGSWQHPQQVQSPQAGQTQSMSPGSSNPVASSLGSMSVPPLPPASLLSPPPPPPPMSSQMQAQQSSSWLHQLATGKTPLLGSLPPPPPPPPPAPGREESAFISSPVTPQQQTLLDIQNQVLQKQQQKVALLTQSGRLGDKAGSSMMMNRDSQLNSPTGGLDSFTNNFNHPQNVMRTGQDSSFSSQNNQNKMMTNQNVPSSSMFEDKAQNVKLSQAGSQNSLFNSSSMPHGQMANSNSMSHGQMANRNFDYHQMSAGSDGQSAGHYGGMAVGQGGRAQNMMSQGNNHQSMMGQGNNHQNMMGQGNNPQNMMNQRYIPQNMMNQGNMHQGMRGQGNNNQNMMGQGNNQNMMGQGNNHQNMMGQGNNHQKMMNQGNASQNIFQGVITPGNNSQNVMNQRNDSPMMNQRNDSPMMNQRNDSPMMNQRNDSPMMSQGNRTQSWNNHQSNANVENNQMEKVKNSSMWN